MAGILDGKRIVVMGVANRRSIAWGCAKSLMDQGAQVILTYQNDRLKRQLEKISPEGTPMIQCDVAEDVNVENTFNKIKEDYGNIDGVLHAIAYADKKTLSGGVIDVEKDGYNLAQDISAYSLIAVSRYASRIMNEGGSIATLTYMGSTRAIPSYNMMGVAKAALEANVRYLARDLGDKGIRVNAISAGAIKTLAVTGIKNHGDLLKESEIRTVDGKSVDIFQIGGTAAFLMSDLSSGITGDLIYVDKGVHLLS
ncbi:enoyl-ACP reductase FabI [Apilactobacillus xinyiensis]|uniref:Enoyl-[acyl-carrier-protein] reductase [NADH] n=1 Tax=Apilactobacillus xinyiensis TaxID=2841032 RepID=A0ABT0I0X1_9LACO|nr:enoyl-ACP reductase FabI [Apilactobacillus xinyiensis]MCK8624482.1 enoyl-ACP reductase FabI [Apilactobacillus xinyiensis]MCL0312077.1 enoyl-ACP reductase FabI [Apilactobacillus xinyiensis]MCL0318651.1 enoyl-ACP reductase FabI [Apilactobacillus xinyiensis]MCL0330413.1 enoyl-ACP reductase FabI [Apilactobacillus xinyiensis]